MKIVFAMSVLLSLLLSGCGSSEQAAASAPERALLGADIDVSKALPIQTIKIEQFPSPEGKRRVRVIAYSEGARTQEERAHTAMSLAAALGRNGAYEVQVWLEAEPEVSRRVAIADYYPYGDMAWGRPAPYVWEVRAYPYGDENNAIAPFPVYFQQ